MYKDIILSILSLFNIRKLITDKNASYFFEELKLAAKEGEDKGMMY